MHQVGMYFWADFELFVRVLSSCVLFVCLGFVVLEFFNSIPLTEQNHAYRLL